MFRFVPIFALGLSLAVAPSFATTIFFDNFDSETGNGSSVSGLSQTNYKGFGNRLLSDGTADFVAQGNLSVPAPSAFVLFTSFGAMLAPSRHTVALET